VDDFKNVNDRYGHSAGDLCLQEVIQRVKSLLRVPDFLARFGGDEVVIILPGTAREEMKAVAERIRSTIERTRFLYQGKQIPIRVSVGGTQIESVDQSVTDVFNRADKALYATKSAGRNNVTVL
jgi:diguanylate cyclase (GGDEF)-like protein